MSKLLKFPTAANYKKLSQIDHVLTRPNTYIGSNKKLVRREWIYDAQKHRIYAAEIDFAPGIERIFVEIITNAVDNANKSRRVGVNPGNIIIEMNDQIIRVTNFGLPIPIEKMEDSDIYVPQMIFGEMLTGSNFEDDRQDGGMNGIGAKATNIFSKQFEIEIYDHKNHKHYTQSWKDNMKNISNPVITDYDEDYSQVTVMYFMDFERFEYEEYNQEALMLFARHAVDLSFTAKIEVKFNELTFPPLDIEEYALLYHSEEDLKHAIIHYQWPAGTKMKKSKKQEIPVDPEILPEVALLILDTPYKGKSISFVNSIMTSEGGVHTQAAINSICSRTKDNVNKKFLEESKKDKDKKDKNKQEKQEKKANTITINDVKPHISIILSVRVKDAQFEGQSKTCLKSPVPNITIPNSKLDLISNWKLIDCIKTTIDNKRYTFLNSKNKEKKSNCMIGHGIHANMARSRNAQERLKCTMIVAEGQSAMAYVNKYIDLEEPIKRGNYHGTLPMKGKGLNVMNVNSLEEIYRNKEIQNIKTMLGLEEEPGMDEETRQNYYLDDKNFEKLNYGKLLIMADSDEDGKHIIALLLNFIYCRFPSLLKRGYVLYYRTPIVRVSKGSEIFKFYSHEHKEKWERETPDHTNWKYDYYKGLGSSDDTEIKEDQSSQKKVICQYDEETPKSMRLAFDKTRADSRKDWITNYDPNYVNLISLGSLVAQNISSFINDEFILFSICNVERSLPKLFDGFKESQRKVIFGVHKIWKGINAENSFQNDKQKTAQVAVTVAKSSKYHHGETILGSVIIGMTDDFIGSNNIAWFEQKGQFGTRMGGSKDAANPRYSHIRVGKLLPYILRREDTPILTSIIDEGEKVEPQFYLPIIPMVLVNGVQGIGTGWSSTVPCHDPFEIINWLKLKLVNKETPKFIKPWYRGFTGVIKVIDRRLRKNPVIYKNKEVIEEEEPEEENEKEYDPEEEIIPGEQAEDENVQTKPPCLSMVSEGVYDFQKANDGTHNVTIKELPIGRWTKPYIAWLESLNEEKKPKGEKKFKMLTTNSTTDKVHIEIIGMKERPNIRKLKLRKTIGMSNMYLLNEKNRPELYSTSIDIIETFYRKRLLKYAERKQYMLEQIEREIIMLNHRVKFIKAVLAKELIVEKRSKVLIYEDLDKLEIPHEIYDKSKTKHFCNEELEKLKENINKILNEKETLISTSEKRIWYSELEQLEKALNVYNQPIVTVRKGKKFKVQK